MHGSDNTAGHANLLLPHSIFKNQKLYTCTMFIILIEAQRASAGISASEMFFFWLIGCGCLDRQVAHIVFDGAPRVLWATIYLLPELRVEQYWY